MQLYYKETVYREVSGSCEQTKKKIVEIGCAFILP